MEYKVASDDWSTVDLGAHPDDATGQTVTVDVAKQLSTSGANLQQDFLDATYRFTVDKADGQVTKLTVSEQP